VTYRAAIIGCGGMARGHARAYRADPRVDLVACADLYDDAANRFGDDFGIPQRFTDYRHMLEEVRPDVLSICTHHHLHAPMTIDAARISAPRAILCEKPIALDLPSADAMIEACDASGTLLVIGHQRRFDRQTAAMKAAVGQDLIGELLFVEAFGHPRSSLLVDSTHTVDLVRYLLGDPEGGWVIGQIDSSSHYAGWGQPIEDGALAWIGFKGGIRLLLGAGSGMVAGEQTPLTSRPIEGGGYHRIVLHGRYGRLELHGDRPVDEGPLVELHIGHESRVLFSASDFDLAWSSVDPEVAEMIDCLEDPARTHRCNAVSARATLEILIGVYESSRRRALVALPLDTADNPYITMLAEGVV
jgi:predicted dehydrogenase